MRKILLTAAILCSLATFGKGKNNQPATVIITAGQSNTDGRVLNHALPDYIQQNKYKYCQWCYGSAGQQITGKFETFWPRMVHKARPGRWAYDAVTYYWLEQAQLSASGCHRSAEPEEITRRMQLALEKCRTFEVGYLAHWQHDIELEQQALE